MRISVLVLGLALMTCSRPNALYPISVHVIDEELEDAVRLGAAKWNEAAGCELVRVRDFGSYSVRLHNECGGRAVGYLLFLPQLGCLPHDEDMVDLAAHELGHALGFGHSPRPYCVMRGPTSPWDPDGVPPGSEICQDVRCAP